jgi:hypothetical protein
VGAVTAMQLSERLSCGYNVAKRILVDKVKSGEMKTKMVMMDGHRVAIYWKA